VNDAAAALAGRTREELVGRTSRELEFWGDPTHTERLFTEIHAKGRARRFPTKVRRPAGELVDVLLSTETIDVHGVRCTLGVILDLTEQRKAEEALRETEEQLRQLQRLEAIGTLAAGIAHDFNNLLSVILSYASMVHGALPAADPLREDVEQIRMAGERAADLTRRLLAFGRRQMLAPRVVDLSAILQSVELMLRRVLGEYTALTIDTSSEPGPVLVDPVQLEQVLVNLVVNARDAMPKGGRVSISARDVELGRDDELCLRLELAAGAYVCVSVADDGVGMTRQQRERAFEPFFTTKEKGRGTGLGLATVYGIVKQSGGGVAVESAEGQGTTMRVYLPRAQRPEEKLAALVADERSLEALDGTETVLVVDDEEALRLWVSATLEKRGYRVLSAGNGAEALRVARAHEGPIDVLLSDVVMPEMSGPALEKILRSERPNVRVLYVSGYTDDRVVLEGVRDATVTLLHKPVVAHVLLAKLREVLRR
jgi:two-component system cell cycle sensor histidine kinase/response regulator CckA